MQWFHPHKPYRHQKKAPIALLFENRLTYQEPCTWSSFFNIGVGGITKELRGELHTLPSVWCFGCVQGHFHICTTNGGANEGALYAVRFLVPRVENFLQISQSSCARGPSRTRNQDVKTICRKYAIIEGNNIYKWLKDNNYEKLTYKLRRIFVASTYKGRHFDRYHYFPRSKNCKFYGKVGFKNFRKFK